MRYYAGIGSRQTPAEILTLFETLAYELSARGWTLRSGCAPGADSAFETGAWRARDFRRSAPRPELYLPWPRFEGRRSTLTARDEPQPEAFPIAEQFHPAWDRLSQGARSLHARNVHQVLGPDVTAPVPSRFVICWTPNASGSGGTGQALRIARHYGVDIFDVADPTAYARVTSLFAS